MTHRLPKQERLAIYDALLAAIGLHTVDEVSAGAARYFIDDTPYEDECLQKGFINGSHAILMRSLLIENGTPEEQSLEPLFGHVREALRNFGERHEPIPKELRPAVRVNVRFYRDVAVWQYSMTDGLVGHRWKRKK